MVTALFGALLTWRGGGSSPESPLPVASKLPKGTRYTSATLQEPGVQLSLNPKEAQLRPTDLPWASSTASK